MIAKYMSEEHVAIEKHEPFMVVSVKCTGDISEHKWYIEVLTSSGLCYINYFGYGCSMELAKKNQC